jgi:hypothetical protein
MIGWIRGFLIALASELYIVHSPMTLETLLKVIP